MLNILLLANDLSYGGPARQASLLAAALPRERFAVHLFTLRPDAPWSRELREAGVAVESGNRRRLFDVQPFVALRRALHDPTPDVVHSFGLPALRALALAGGRHGARVVLSAAAPGERSAQLGVLDRRLIASFVDRVVARWPAEAERLRRLGIAAAKVVQVSPGGTSMPVSPGATTSASPGQCDATTARPAAIASSAVIAPRSARLGTHTTSAWPSNSLRSARSPRKWTRAVERVMRVNSRRRGSCGPVPTSSRWRSS